MILSGSTDLTWPKWGGSCFFQLNFKENTFNSWKSGPTDDFCHLQFYLNGGSEVSNRGKCVGLGTGIPGHLVVTITAIGSFRSMAKLEVFFQKTTGIHGILSKLLLVSFVHVVFSFWTYLWDDLFWKYSNPCCLWLDVLDFVSQEVPVLAWDACAILSLWRQRIIISMWWDVCWMPASMKRWVDKEARLLVLIHGNSGVIPLYSYTPLNANPPGNRIPS